MTEGRLGIDWARRRASVASGLGDGAREDSAERAAVADSRCGVSRWVRAAEWKPLAVVLAEEEEALMKRETPLVGIEGV